jgi:hypothetical protein
MRGNAKLSERFVFPAAWEAALAVATGNVKPIAQVERHPQNHFVTQDAC